MKDKRLYQCPECKHTVHSVGNKWRCRNPNCRLIFVRDPEVVKGGRRC